MSRIAIILFLALCLSSLGGARCAFAAHPVDLTDPDAYAFAQDYMLMLINQERRLKGSGSLRLDPLAGQLAKQHAEDMLTGDFFSHWNRDGIKPTRRYNLIGGYDGLGENICFVVDSYTTLEEFIERVHRVLMDSKGHRKTLLDPSYTHVGLGFGHNANGRAFYCAQEFIAKVGGEYSCPLSARVGESVEFSGRFDPQNYEFLHVIVSYEELPEPRSRSWLAKTGSYQDGDKQVAGYVTNPRVKFQGMETYSDLMVDEVNGLFKANVLLDYKRKPGLYYISVWLGDRQSRDEFVAATATVEAR